MTLKLEAAIMAELLWADLLAESEPMRRGDIFWQLLHALELCYEAEHARPQG